MTQQYIVGEFSSLLADLEPAPGECVAAVARLRREVEHAPVWGLGPLAHEAMSLTDVVCWAALEGGDENNFCRYAATAAALREFTGNAGLLP
jgi:hypothetical protein